jgi:hypothetical protein
VAVLELTVVLGGYLFHPFFSHKKVQLFFWQISQTRSFVWVYMCIYNKKSLNESMKKLLFWKD